MDSFSYARECDCSIVNYLSVGRDKDFQSLKDPDSSTNFGLLTGSG